ncbi:cytochrome c oxidase subunit I [Cereibacter azotoformans]|uniref:cytochrome-c oxidase n=1 Tax=Cereibacter azotoformans TaxID=43057 RepID=A0A2T5K5W7_9RHOB|nr:cytochrome c oxidase subunit I [Cereibacter azotoformans]AXQ95633.1 cytochrome c oxidase subunit I [Cereibacter sphaeroides]PTR17826.1 cytochrome c oxidase subunit I+III [Cereibacter azotoformans]UIJ32118.1 cytochrome c oxidase subunit I [Cereibacter azotoformans]
MNALRRHRILTRIWASEPGWRGWFTTVNHTDLGRMFMFASAVFFLIGGILAMLIRAQLASPRSAFVGAETYAQLFTMHGTIMMFLFAIPLFEGLTIYLLPKLLGSRDLAYPRLSAYGFWCYVLGGSMLIFALLAGIAPDSGWFMYPPLASTLGSPGINSDFWLLGITFVEISAIAAAVEIVVTVLRFRAPGMSLDRMPIYGWYALVTATMILTGFPPLILGSILLELERAFGLPFFQVAEGGDSLLWQHLFWLFGHPEVYIIFLPAAGAISTILPVMARTELMGYRWVVAAAIALAVLSFGLWVHHMFTTGIPHMGLALFSAASTLVAVPTAVQIFAWIGTLWRGSPQMRLPMMWILAFFATFVIGGLTGVMVAVVPFDWQVHDTHFIVAHLHYVLVGGFVFPMLAALYYWMPHVTGRKRFFRVGDAAFWLITLGFHATFLAVHWVGLLGQRRRTETYDPGQGWEVINLISSIGGFVMAIGFGLVLLDVAMNALVAVRGSRNPWRAGTLEWAMPTPPPAYNFASLPQVTTREPLHEDPDLGVRIAKGEFYLGEPRGGRRETLMVEVASGTPAALVVYPGNSALPFQLALATGLFFLGMLLKTFWLVPLALAGVAALGCRWVWSLTSSRDEGRLPVGRGESLPREVPDTPGWWGSLFLLLADATLFGSLMFGYAFLWTVAPNWPPPEWLQPSMLLIGLLLGGAATAPLLVRLALRSVAGGGSPTPALAGALLGLGALSAAALMLLFALPVPQRHAYDATVWVIGGYAGFHALLALGMTLFVMVMQGRGRLSALRIAPLRILRLWIDWAAFVGLVGVAAACLPGVLA